jgi:hypothetical protein
MMAGARACPFRESAPLWTAAWLPANMAAVIQPPTHQWPTQPPMYGAYGHGSTYPHGWNEQKRA